MICDNFFNESDVSLRKFCASFLTEVEKIQGAKAKYGILLKRFVCFCLITPLFERTTINHDFHD